MEIYVGKQNTVRFKMPSGVSSASATASLNGGTPINLVVTVANEVASATLPYVTEEGTVDVNWSFDAQTFNGNESVTVTDSYEVVTPILSELEVREVHPNATESEIERVEKATRHIINAHTGQTFGRYIGVKRVYSEGNNALRLPARLINLLSVNGSANINSSFYLVGDGYAIKYGGWGVPPVKADNEGLHYHTGGVIHNPNSISTKPFSGIYYDIEGEWGWPEVPSQVKEAAKLLINDYACADNSYRDRYLTSMTAADWRIQYHSGAFRETGNVRADQLLNDYVLKNGWAVV